MRNVIAVVMFRSAFEATVTIALVPLKLSALPKRPCVVQLAPVIVPALPWPESSGTDVSVPASNEYAATASRLPAATGVAMSARISASSSARS